jgi:hypothetical protein
MSSIGMRATACCAVALGLMILPARSTQADAARAPGATTVAGAPRLPTRVELTAPEDKDLKLCADQGFVDTDTRKTRLEGSVALTWKNGMQLRSPRAEVVLGSPASGAFHHISAEPLPAAPVELRLPDGLELKSIVGDTIHVRDSKPREMRIEGDATVEWANGLQMKASRARVTLLETGPGRWGRVRVEPLAADPAARGWPHSYHEPPASIGFRYRT